MRGTSSREEEKEKGRSQGGFGFGGLRRRSYVVTQDDIRAYFGIRGNPKGRDGTTMTCRICNSEEHFAARCPQGKGGGKGSGLPSATFHVAESRQAAGQLTWPGMNPDEEVDGPLALLIRDLGASADHAFLWLPVSIYPWMSTLWKQQIHGLAQQQRSR